MKNRFATKVPLAIFALALAVSASTPLWGQHPPKIAFNVKFAPPKSTVLITGKNFTPNANVVIELDQVPIGEARTNASGAFSRAQVFIPSGTTEGYHLFTAIDSVGLTGSSRFLIVTNWPQQRFGPGNTANNPFEWKLDTTTVQNLTLAWNTVGKPGPCPWTTAIVFGFVVYFVNDTAGLQALDPATGSLLWGFDTSGQNNYNCGISPTGANIAGKQLVFLGNGLSEMVAVNTSTHGQAWSQGGFSSSGFAGWPVAVGSALFISDRDGNLASLKQSTGIRNWLRPASSWFPIAWNKGELFTESGPSMGAYNANTGALVWQTPGCAPLASAPVVVGTALYESCNFHPSLLDAASGTLLWSNTDVLANDMALANGMLYGSLYDNATGNLIIGALAASNGNVAWADNEGPSNGVFHSDPITANGVVYMGLGFGDCSQAKGQSYVVAVDGSNGNLLWAYQFSGPCNINYPAVPSALVDGTLYVVHTPDGATGELWAFRQP